MKIIYILCLFLISAETVAQDFNMTWGEMHKTQGVFRDVEQINNSNDFSKYNYYLSSIHHVYELYNYHNLSYNSSAVIEVKIDGYYYLIEKLIHINNLTYVFMSSSLTKDGIKLLVQKYDEGCVPVGGPVEVLTHGEKTRAYRSNFSIELTKDQKNIVIGRYPDIGKDEILYRYYDLNLKPMGEESSYLGGFEFVANKFASLQKVTVTSKNNENRKLVLAGLDGSFDVFLFDTKGYNLITYKFNSDEEGFITISGLYTEKDEEKIVGTFSSKFNTRTNLFVSSNFDRFDKSFTLSGLEGKALEKAKKASEPIEIPSYQYYFREVINTVDGGVLLIIENKETVFAGNVSSEYDGDIYLIKYGKEGKVSWSKQINHILPALSSSLKSTPSSFSFSTDGKVYLLFNDRILNYDTAGNYDGKQESPGRYGKEASIVGERLYKYDGSLKGIYPAVIELDALTGDLFSRHILVQNNPMPMIPGLFKRTNDPHKILMYARTAGMEGFGVLEF